MDYCPGCGTKLQVRQERLVWFCPGCRRHHYANPIPVIDALFVDNHGKILLGRRNQEPEKGKLNLPGGFVDMGETLEEALQREIQEELGMKPSEYGAFSYGGSRLIFHKQEGNERQLVGVIMRARLAHRDFAPNDEVSEYVWRDTASLKADELTTQAEYDHIMTALQTNN
jgi:8-oxo-dGTP pyrophosphatase MutT (NUDIX family)